MTQRHAVQPWSEQRFAMKWAGEWHATYETFRDMGIAFAVALLLIYLQFVAQFQSFLTPVVIVAPIPLTLIGILRGHWLTGSCFTATSMIGFIALAVSSCAIRFCWSISFNIRRRRRVSLLEAVIRAGAVRTRPILLTAAALMVGAFVIILDPISQRLASLAVVRRQRLDSSDAGRHSRALLPVDRWPSNFICRPDTETRAHRAATAGRGKPTGIDRKPDSVPRSAAICHNPARKPVAIPRFGAGLVTDRRRSARSIGDDAGFDIRRWKCIIFAHRDTMDGDPEWSVCLLPTVGKEAPVWGGLETRLVGAGLLCFIVLPWLPGSAAEPPSGNAGTAVGLHDAIQAAITMTPMCGC
ncbi:MAG: efflux RND transporter permease subunit [Nitrospira sp.]|nr:efflux RND transporter permease subunit [Nitrospira sp.]